MGREKKLKPRKLPAQARSKETVEIILQAATRVFAEHGYAGGTTNKIAERAGVSIGSLYQYFPNKDAILARLLERHIDEGMKIIVERMSEAPQFAGQPQKILRLLIEGIVDFHLQEPELNRVLFETAPQAPETFAMLATIEKKMAGDVERLLAVIPGVRVRNLPLAARLLVHAVEGLTHWFAIYGRDEFSRPDFIDEMSTLVSRYLFNG